MMNRKGRDDSFGSKRVICKRLAGVEFARVGCEGGTKRPLSRKDLMFDIRRREDADGESRMMGSARLEEDTAGRDVREADEGWARGLAIGAALRCLPRKVSAALRTWEKSYVYVSSLAKTF